MKKLKKQSVDSFERIATKSTRWIGSISSIIVHTLLFLTSFFLYFLGVDMDKILLVITTIVSLEAIYLAIFIQMSLNQQHRKLEEVAEDVEEIQEDVEGIEKDIDEIQEDVEGIEKDIDEIQEDVEEDSEEEKVDDQMLVKIEDKLGRLIEEIINLKKHQEDKDK